MLLQCNGVTDVSQIARVPRRLTKTSPLGKWTEVIFGTKTTNCALGFSERYLSKTDEIRLYMIDSDSRGDISAISLPIGNAPKSFSRWHKQTSCKPQLKKTRIIESPIILILISILIDSFIHLWKPLNLDQGRCGPGAYSRNSGVKIDHVLDI